ncbi:unnamed protein product [Clonostachys byssicola]|uniref:Uncharacterized protein n=1 Tax=Clonostachys byssicola TaxID=160290 RepID=A0A9N9Y971_9HYPO|nr:unnamed protein product [Clonostachys byssicola]
MAWIVKGLREGLDRFTSEGEELKLCSQLLKNLDSTLSALEKITETLDTAPGTSETLNDIDKTLHWLEEYCDTFLEKDTFQDKSQRQMCYDTVEHVIIQIEHIMKLFNTADLFRCVLREAEVCYGNLKECEVAIKKLSISLEKYPGTAEPQAQKARKSPQQRRPVLGTAPGGLPGLRTLPGLPALRAPPGRLSVLVTPEDQFPRIHPNESERG